MVDTSEGRERLVALEVQMREVRHDLGNLRAEHRAGIEVMQRDMREMRDAMVAAKAAKWVMATLGGLITFALGVASSAAGLFRGQ